MDILKAALQFAIFTVLYYILVVVIFGAVVWLAHAIVELFAAIARRLNIRNGWGM